jgi:hypothetical protein
MLVLRKLSLATLCMALWSYCGVTLAQDANYLEAVSPRRLALVIGNATYENIEPVNSAVSDADKIEKLLTDAKFSVTSATNVKTRNSFLELYFLPFVEKIQEGDFVVFYFSGHGFTYAGENYLVPTKFPSEVTDDEIFSTFLSVTGLQGLISDRKPAVLIMFLDACRNIADFIKHKDPQKNHLIEKGLNEIQPPDNIIIGFSSRGVKTSFGDETPGQLSRYTASLAKNLPKSDTELGSLKRFVVEDVRSESNKAQVPWFSESNTAEIYFHPSQVIYDQELTVWKSVLAAPAWREVTRFLNLYSVSLYAAAARRWLAENPKQLAEGFTRVSPFGPELAWRNAGSNDRSILLRNVSGPLAYLRTTQDLASTGSNDSGSAIRVSDVVANVGTNRKDDRAEIAAVFTRHGDAIISGRVTGRAEPTRKSDAISELAVGTTLSVLGVERNKNNEIWGKVLVPGTSQPVYVNFPPDAGFGETNIGKPLSEINVSTPASGLQSLVDEAPVLSELRTLVSAKKSIEWVSIATPKTTEEHQAAVYGLRAIYLIGVLEKAGISRRRITTLENAADLVGTDLRVRFFGN